MWTSAVVDAGVAEVPGSMPGLMRFQIAMLRCIAGIVL